MSKNEITGQQENVYNFIKKVIIDKGYPPSIREICHGVGLKSTSTVHSHLLQLEKKGYIRRDASLTRAIEILGPKDDHSQKLATQNTIAVPLVGEVTAGEPMTAIQNIEQTFHMPQELIGNCGKLFMLTVKGESMTEAGIFDGDYIIVLRQKIASNGDIVVAMIDGEATVKRFYKEIDKSRIRLQPENSSMEPIYTTEASILGKVIGLYRKI